ncbi:GNAT family N-acetyltransferase [Anaerocolumna xylanovorans]|uniref:Acetyltransferase (GNAT) domain-containing protein n=1 Tax=Anaerocolumna xylanovorans DSM 12503 TaxID=1121345 RepID=A0A1M7YG38_9FIRM|nr:GNAT family N-acetyltransferase [Anaerocolumna xylanovorans]SHO51602.1 Acetyltransferase (GNAT) domain-containing protein [Anaerocolumna xylanovorans DSM 12503]
MIVYIEDEKQKELISSTILSDLPDWFGLPDSTAEYIRCSKELPFWAEIENDTAKGFITLKETSSYTAEIYVMGVRKAVHKNGIGKKLFDAFYSYAKEHGYSFIQVKTVEEGHYDEYDRTIQFYKKLGFKELECFPTLWDEWNPCQIYIMAIK